MELFEQIRREFWRSGALTAGVRNAASKPWCRHSGSKTRQRSIGRRGISVREFNDHRGSTKSYLYTRQNELRATAADFVPPEKEILAQISPNGTTTVTMHNGGTVKFTSVPSDYDPTDRRCVSAYLQEHLGTGEIVTGLLYLDESTADFHDTSQTSETPLTSIP